MKRAPIRILVFLRGFWHCLRIGALRPPTLPLAILAVCMWSFALLSVCWSMYGAVSLGDGINWWSVVFNALLFAFDAPMLRYSIHGLIARRLVEEDKKREAAERDEFERIVAAGYYNS